MAFQTLNRLKWTGRLMNCEVTFLHRGAPGDRKTVSGTQITEVKKGYFSFESRGWETTIPMHRILEIGVDGETVWEKLTRQRKRTSSST